MIFELVYTSAPEGLFPGNTGFSVVECSRNMDAALRRQLESLSAYTPLYAHYDSRARRNPVNYAHRIIESGGQSWHVLSRICFNGLDYTQRSNQLASHIALTPDELPGLPGGPAALFFQENLFRDESWRIRTGYLEHPPVLRNISPQTGRCTTWEQMTGDAGWAGVVAESFLADSRKKVWIVFDPERSDCNLRLLNEALMLLPAYMRWNVTFSTYFTELPANTICHWRFCPPGSAVLQQAGRNPAANLVIDLTACPGRAQGGTLVEAARTGKPPEVAAPFAGIPVSPSIPPVAAVQNTALLPPAPASGGWKAAACIAFVLLGIFAVVFPVVKISDARKIEAHTERTEKLFSILQRSLQSRIAVAEAVDVSIPPPPSDRELLAKIKEFVGKLPEKVEKRTAFSGQAVDFFRQAVAQYEALSAYSARLERLSRAAEEEETLCADLDAVAGLSARLRKEMTESAAPIDLEYSARIDSGLIAARQEDARKVTALWLAILRSLAGAFPDVEFPDFESLPGFGRTRASSEVWLEQGALFKALNGSGRYSIRITDLPDEYRICKFYWGKDSIEPGPDGCYEIPAGDGKARIELKWDRHVLTVTRRDEGKRKIELEEVAIQFSRENDETSRWLNFYFSEQTKLEVPEQLSFRISSGRGIVLILPRPAGVERGGKMTEPFEVALLVPTREKITMSPGESGWEAPIVPSEESVAEIRSLEQLSRLAGILQQQIRNGIAVFPPEVKALPAYRRFVETSPEERDVTALVDAVAAAVPIGKWGVHDVPEEYAHSTLWDALDAVRRKIGVNVLKQFPDLRIELSLPARSWRQTVVVKEVIPVVRGGEK